MDWSPTSGLSVLLEALEGEGLGGFASVTFDSGGRDFGVACDEAKGIWEGREVLMKGCARNVSVVLASSLTGTPLTGMAKAMEEWCKGQGWGRFNVVVLPGMYER